MVNIFRQLTGGIREFLSDYCLSSTVCGLGYIANKRYHLTERIFWFACFTASAYGSYYLIMDYYSGFEKHSISMVVEELAPLSKTPFPSVAICEKGYNLETYSEMENIVKSLPGKEYSYTVEDFLSRIIFQNLYSFNNLSPLCLDACDACQKCPQDGYKDMAKRVRANCSQLFTKCSWMKKPFDCCKYFLPIQTTLGNCFLLNNIHTAKKYKQNWFNMKVNVENRDSVLEIDVEKPVTIDLLNEEDIPNVLLIALQNSVVANGTEGIIKIDVQNIVNDPDVYNINPKYRKCFFPEEVDPKYIHKYYSFSVCVTNCLREAQLKICNCTNYNMILNATDKTPVCDYDGFMCLDKENLIHPQTLILQYWRTKGVACKCLPSCTANEIKVVEWSTAINSGRKTKNIQISFQQLPHTRYRRQAVRNSLDMVVSIGGIISLFMGASILSAIELLYFFTVRILGKACLQKNQQQMN